MVARTTRRPDGEAHAPHPHAADRRQLPGRLRGRTHARARRGRHARARRPLLLLLPPVRIAFDVSPLSHPRTGIGNYVQGSLAGLAEAAAGRHELIAFAPTRPRGRRLIREALADVPVDVRTLVLPWSHAFRMGVEPPRPAFGRAFPRPGRRPPLQRLDGAAAAARAPVDDGARPRAAPASGVGDTAHTLDARLQVLAHRRMRPRLRQLGLHRPRCGGALERAARASPRRTAGSGRRVHGGRRACRARPAVRAQPRDARAAQESRDAGRGVAAAAGRAGAGGRGCRRLGRPAAPRRSRDPQARLRRTGARCRG